LRSRTARLIGYDGGMKFRPRFSLRTLLLVITAAAVLCWGYWVAWPSWLVYREQCQFEATFKQLHVGCTTEDMLALPLSEVRAGVRAMEYFGRDRAWRWFMRRWPNAVYVGVFLGESSMMSQRVPFKSVALYRLSPVPKGYQPLSAWMRKAWPRFTAEDIANLKAEYASRVYAQDFLDFIIDDPNHNPGFKYELIYADPPSISN